MDLEEKEVEVAFEAAGLVLPTLSLGFYLDVS